MERSKHTSQTPADLDRLDRNPDPITDEPGSHPVATGLGAVAGGAALGAAGGAVAGPVGAVAGAVIGGVAGGYAGHAAGEAVDPTVEDAYWEENYRSRDYVTGDADYATYRPAYQYGWEARSHHGERTYDEVETDLAQGWDDYRGEHQMDWEQARYATRDAYERPGRQDDGTARPNRPR